MHLENNKSLKKVENINELNKQFIEEFLVLKNNKLNVPTEFSDTANNYLYDLFCKSYELLTSDDDFILKDIYKRKKIDRLFDKLDYIDFKKTSKIKRKYINKLNKQIRKLFKRQNKLGYREQKRELRYYNSSLYRLLAKFKLVKKPINIIDENYVNQLFREDV